MNSDLPRVLRCAVCLLMIPLLAPAAPRGGRDSVTVDPGAAPWSVKTLLQYQRQLHPDMDARDVYKLLYQAAYGVEHLLTDTAGVKAYLMEELARTDDDSLREPLLERIAPDGAMVRVNLRPLKRLNFPADSLVKAMFASAAETIAGAGMLKKWWNEYMVLIHDRQIPSPPDLARWTGMMEKGEIGPAHHSARYVEANRPAYRVVRRDIMLPMLNNSGIP